MCHDNFPGNNPTAHGSAGDLPAWLERKNATKTSFESTASLADAPADLQPKVSHHIHLHACIQSGPYCTSFGLIHLQGNTSSYAS